MPKLPQQFLNSLKALDSFDERAFVAAHDSDSKLTSIRLNPFKTPSLDFELNQAVPWTKAGFYLDERPSFTTDPLFQAGCYYVQEAGSMFLEHAFLHTLNFSETLRVLDSCAAPGGKSTLINSLLNEESLLVSNELVKSRAEVLVQNLNKWGTANTIVCNGETQKFSELSSFFDAIIVDAPCSGSGLFRKQPESIDEWSESHVKTCSVRQHKILQDLIPALKENGILFYSTCSYAVEENEQVIERLLTDFDLELVEIPTDKSWGIVKTAFGYRFYPHLTKSEGFFCSVLRKKGGTQSVNYPKKKKINAIQSKELNFLKNYVDCSNKQLIKINERYHLLNEAALSFLTEFEKHLYFKKAGVTIGEIKGKDLVPNQELAWYYKQHETITQLELTKENSLRFLRKEQFYTEENTRGLALICYKGYGLGWAKILPNRINNYFPNELRILK
jgi:16S rRNA C967 or C1407 C5-methylase (RsmB/RsmF family)/NOL1/NOP2/fmu family ribosome biogenesis protein